MHRCLLLVLLALALASCVQVPRQQLSAFRLQFEAVQDLSKGVAAENQSMKELLDRHDQESGSVVIGPDGLPIFDPANFIEQRGYLDAYEAVWHVLGSYIKVLEDLAADKPRDELTQSLQTLTDSILSTAQTVLAAYGLGALVEPIKALADLILKTQAAERFRVAVRDAHPILVRLANELVKDTKICAATRNMLEKAVQSDLTIPIAAHVSAAVVLLDATAVRSQKSDKDWKKEFLDGAQALADRLAQLPETYHVETGLIDLRETIERHKQGKPRPPAEGDASIEARERIKGRLLTSDDVLRVQLIALRCEPLIAKGVGSYNSLLAYHELLGAYVKGLAGLSQAHAKLYQAASQRVLPDLAPVFKHVAEMREAWSTYVQSSER